ncbi:MAG: YkgJ family cysteine cluster protein [Bacteriovorax sp.]|nr:YkgJ family cysteine cluster protein [Bacteriovorax sp.]
MHNRELSKAISEKLSEVSDVFGHFQQKTGLTCPTGCGKCCLKADISCSPYELLPMAFNLIDTGRAEEVLENARLYKENICLFLKVNDQSQGTGSCSEYEHRPFICRAFGLSARRGKHEIIERLICKTLSEIEISKPHIKIVDEEIPQIDLWKKRLESIDPHLLENELPIHQGIAILLERLLLWKKLSEQT